MTQQTPPTPSPDAPGPLAVLADIHGNATALAAVLADATRRGVTRLVNLGDTFYGPLDPAGTWRLLRDMDIPTVLGNQDRILLEPGWQSVPAIRAAREALGPDGLAWLARLPARTVVDPGIYLCHGTPESDTAYLLEDVSSGSPRLRSCADIVADLAAVPDECSLVLTGHSHCQGAATCGGITVVNPGSVGLPAYDDDSPPHAMAAGTPQARYAILTPARREADAESHWKIDFAAVDYDWESAARLAKANGRPDWARWLATGLA
jgi:predicted phosphodiesterase